MNERIKTALRMWRGDAREGMIREALKETATHWDKDDAEYLTFALDLAAKACTQARRIEAGELVEGRFAAVIHDADYYSISCGETDKEALEDARDAAGWSNSWQTADALGTVYLELPTVADVEADVDSDE